MDAVRFHVRYTGRVQGVYFRATAAQIAEEEGVSGFVRNLPDGSVELEAQGGIEACERLFSRLAERYAGHIENVEKQPMPAREIMRGFEIRR